MPIKKLLISGIGFLFFTQLAAQIEYRGLPEWSWHHQDSTEYYLYTPRNMEPGKKYPVALFLHGCCGTSYTATLRNAVDPPARMWHQFGKDQQSIPTYIIAPATSRGWKQHFSNLKKVIDDLIEFQQADPQRIYICGFSMGGDGTYRMLQAYPGFFAAALPMGMSFHGDSTLVQNTPIWVNRGETDWFSRFLPKNVADIRHLNGYEKDTGATWVTGVNPRFSDFKGMGHGVQWAAASTQDLTGWAYSKINDGNLYPNIYFSSPSYGLKVANGASILLEIVAKDPDGTIQKVILRSNGKKIAELTKPPYQKKIKIKKGDNLIEALAVDNGGKSSTATLLIRSNIQPQLANQTLPGARCGETYHAMLTGTGNGSLMFSNPDSNLPDNFQLYPNGLLKGYPIKPGNLAFRVRLTDEDGETTEKDYTLKIAPKIPGKVVISEPRTDSGTTYRIRSVQLGESPYFDRKETILSPQLDEINFSDVGPFDGTVMIQTAYQDANQPPVPFLHFQIDEDATLYIAYETLGPDSTTTIPNWLKSFKYAGKEITAQYRYFRIYEKDFGKGVITIPGADAQNNHVAGNYFIMISNKRKSE